MEAIILAGGAGTRLRDVISDVPKSMAPVQGRPFLEYLMDGLIAKGVTRAVLSVGYKMELIIDHFRGRYRSLELAYVTEEQPLGTGGGIRKAFSRIDGERAFVLNGDSLFDADLERMLAFHSSTGASVTLALKHVPDIARYGAVETDTAGRITGFREKGSLTGPGYINGGIYIIEKQFILSGPFPEKFSVEKDCFERYYRDYMMTGFRSDGYFIDIGIPSDYEKAQNEFGKLDI